LLFFSNKLTVHSANIEQSFSESKATIRNQALARSQKNILKHRRIFFMLFFFVVSWEKRITKQMFFVLCGYFFSGKSHRFLKFEKSAGVFFPYLATHDT